jgi:ATP-dependent Lon protease
MDNTDVKEIVNTEIKKFVNDMLDKEMKKILQSKGSASRNELVDMVRNAFDAVYKVLWQKKDFWKTDIK